MGVRACGHACVRVHVHVCALVCTQPAPVPIYLQECVCMHACMFTHAKESTQKRCAHLWNILYSVKSTAKKVPKEMPPQTTVAEQRGTHAHTSKVNNFWLSVESEEDTSIQHARDWAMPWNGARKGKHRNSKGCVIKGRQHDTYAVAHTRAGTHSCWQALMPAA